MSLTFIFVIFVVGVIGGFGLLVVFLVNRFKG